MLLGFCCHFTVLALPGAREGPLQPDARHALRAHPLAGERAAGAEVAPSAELVAEVELVRGPFLESHGCLSRND